MANQKEGIKALSIQRKLYLNLVGRKELIKAIALSLFVKKIFSSSVIQDFSYNKLRKLTGLSITTLKKRVATLKQMHLVEFVGKNKEHLSFLSITNRHKRRNLDISYFIYDNIEELEKSLFASFLVEIQRRKNFAKYMIQCAYDGNNLKEIKQGRRACRHYDFGKEYVELGISYKRIAKDMGVSIPTAICIVKWAAAKNLVIKENRQVQKYCKGIGKDFELISKYVDKQDRDFTFCTKDNKYIILANNYVLTPLTSTPLEALLRG